MPTFDKLESSQVLKVLYMGDSSVGKTGSLCSLAAAGYTVRILDLDNGVELIKDFVTNPKSMYTGAKAGLWSAEQCHGIASRMSYVTITETIKILQGAPTPTGDAWSKILGQLNSWKDGGQDLGNVGTWGADTILVIDGLTKLAMAAWRFQLKMNGRLLSRPEQNDWWQAQKLISDVLGLLQSTEVRCHVIVICHIDYIEKDDGLTRGFPQTVGKALSPKVPQDFNHTLLAKSSGQGAGVRRKIITNTTGAIDLKNTAPLRVKPEYDLETGLAEYWRDVLQQAAGGTEKK